MCQGAVVFRRKIFWNSLLGKTNGEMHSTVLSSGWGWGLKKKNKHSTTQFSINRLTQ